MSRPLIITDCDEVLLHMVVPFRHWLDETHDVHFDMREQGFAEALRHKDSGIPLERELVWELLIAFFDTEMARQTPISGAVEALHRLGVEDWGAEVFLCKRLINQPSMMTQLVIRSFSMSNLGVPLQALQPVGAA